MARPLIRIPRDLLHVGFDDLRGLGVPEPARAALQALLADLPLVPEATHSAALVGPRQIALPCLAVLARHVGQGLRDHNLSLAHDRSRLHLERRKLAFMDGEAMATAVAAGDPRPTHEAVLFVLDGTPDLLEILAARHAAGLASFVTAATKLEGLAGWRLVNLSRG